MSKNKKKNDVDIDLNIGSEKASNENNHGDCEDGVCKVNFGNETTDDNVEVVEEVKEDPKQKEIDTLKDSLLRTAAEYENYRRRTSKQLMDKESETIAKTVGEILPVLDNLERALSSETTDANYKQGIKMIAQGFKEVLTKLGVEEIVTDGAFDPTLHQAVQRIADDSKNSGDIAAVYQKGYKLGDRVIRFSVVVVVE